MTDRFPVIDPWFVAPRYCQHGMLDDDYCEECERAECEEDGQREVVHDRNRA